MRNQIMHEKVYAGKYFPLILTSCFYVLFYLCVRSMTGDDVSSYYPKAHDGTPLFDFLKWHYSIWSSRVIIEGVMILVLRLPFVVWKLITGLLVSALLWTIYYLFFSKEKPVVIWILCASFMLCNFSKLSTSAGWVATTLNYIWPVAALFFSFIPVKMIETTGKPNNPYYLLFVPVMFFAANQELYCIIMLLVSSLFLAITVKQKRPVYYYYLLFAVSVASLLFILTCPGNAARFTVENRWYPRFGELSLLQKSAIGIMTLFNWIVITNPWLFLLSSLVIVLILYFDENEKLIYRIISLIPLGGSVFVFVINFFAIRLPGVLMKANRMIVDYRFGGLPQGEQYHTIPRVAQIAFIISVLAAFILCIYIIFKNTKRTLLLLLIILSGLISQLVLSFSPTVYASSIRTATLLFITLAIMGTSFFSYYAKNRDMRKTGMLSLSLVFAVITFASMAIQFIQVWRAE